MPKNNMRKFFLTLVVALLACPSLMAEQRSELYGQRASLFDMLGTDSTDIVFLGNSLIHGGNWAELLGNPNVVNRGINGDTADGINDRLESVLRGRPAKIFLICGANDVSHDLEADSIATAVIGLADRITAESPSTKLYVMSLLPINNSYNRYRRLAGKEQVIRDTNTALEALCAARGLTWINLYPSFADADGNLRTDLTNDGLHLLGPGYAIWTEIVKPYVEE